MIQTLRAAARLFAPTIGFAAISFYIGSAGCAQVAPTTHPADAYPVLTPAPVGQTEPVLHDKDAADDSAIWVNAKNPADSLIIVTEKKNTLHTYSLDGKERQSLVAGLRPNNVDVLYGFALNGQTVDLAVAACRVRAAAKAPAGGLKIWMIDRDTGQLSDVTAGNSPPVTTQPSNFPADEFIRVVGGEEPYGSTVYHSPRSGKSYVFINDKAGLIEQYELTAMGSKIGATLVRKMNVPTQPEGCVCDDENGVLYLGEEKVGIWRFNAEPDADTEGRLIARVGEHGLVADVEGITFYAAPGNRGYLIASSQGNSTLKVYDRTGNNAFVATIDPKPLMAGDKELIGDVEMGDGVAVTATPCGPLFPHGLLVVHDGDNLPLHQNFKLYRWEDVAGNTLIVGQ